MLSYLFVKISSDYTEIVWIAVRCTSELIELLQTTKAELLLLILTPLT
jgi:hypothetical protein